MSSEFALSMYPYSNLHCKINIHTFVLKNFFHLVLHKHIYLMLSYSIYSVNNCSKSFITIPSHTIHTNDYNYTHTYKISLKHYFLTPYIPCIQFCFALFSCNTRIVHYYGMALTHTVPPDDSKLSRCSCSYYQESTEC